MLRCSITSGKNIAVFLLTRPPFHRPPPIFERFFMIQQIRFFFNAINLLFVWYSSKRLLSVNFGFWKLRNDKHSQPG